jgi:hypothetical protein
MYTIEFETVIEDSLVKLPAAYAQSLVGKVKVIVLKEEPLEDTSTVIDELLAHPLEVPNFVPLSRAEIYAEI